MLFRSLECFVDETMAKADATRASLTLTSAKEEADIQQLMHQLERIQQQRGVMGTASSRETQLVTLKEQQMALEQKLTEEHAHLSQTQSLLEESQRTLGLERTKAEHVKNVKARAMEAKKTTVEDLTYAIVKYRMLGLDFVKGDTGPTSLQCNFTLLDPQDPQRIFSFVLQVSPEDEYQVDKCCPPLAASTIMNLVEELNS